MNNPGSSFLHERNSNLHDSTEVTSVVDYLRQNGESIPNEPSDKISAYLGFLANRDYVNDGILTGDKDSMDRQIEAASVAVTEENAQANFKFEIKVARELGRGGDINSDSIDDRTKLEMLHVQHNDQVAQLAEWSEELNSDENAYPDWFKYWTFENVRRHTTFNDAPGKNGGPKGFERRSASTFGLFPELDRESVSLVYDALVEKLGGQQMGFEYENLRQLLAKANFNELYGEAQNYGFKITDRLKEITTGSWHDFQQSDDMDDAERLSKLVRSYRTGWCTAGEETAQKQLAKGDFSVWCSTNPDTGEDDVPRIAVRMEEGKVAEVRGVVGGKRQELEPELVGIVEDKTKDLPGGNTYFRKAEDMKRLTVIERKIATNLNGKLTLEDIRFLYEVDHEIQGFGYTPDPRIAEIRAKRGVKDKSELLSILPETIREQLSSAFAGYTAVAEKLDIKGRIFRRGETRLSHNKFEKLFFAKDKEWHENGVYDYLAEQLIQEGCKFSLIATPNVGVSEYQVLALAKSFGDDQPYQTSLSLLEDDSKDSHVNKIEWSGKADSALVRFSLIASKLDGQMRHKPLNEQVKLLRIRQANHPELGIKVPSPLDVMVYWHRLRAGGDLGADSHRKTFVRHFDMEPKINAYQQPYIPTSFISSRGKPHWQYSHVRGDVLGGTNCRLAVG